MSPEPDSLRNSLLIASLRHLDVPHFLSTAISSAARATREHLVIILVSPLFNACSDEPASGISHTEKWREVQCILTFAYVQATKVAQDMDKVLMEVDVLLRGKDEGLMGELANDMDNVFYVQEDTLPISVPGPIAALPAIYVEPAQETPALHAPSPSSAEHHPSTFRAVALGGTFDHLHAGHKILLSMGAWIARKLVVGITDEPLLVHKAYRDVLEPLAVRIERVRQFVELFRPGLKCVLVPIVDVCGPTAWDPEIEALVVSKETLLGAHAIAARRAENGLPALHTFTIDVISPELPELDHHDVEMLKATKMSSTFIREWIAKRQAATGRDNTK